MDAPDPADGPDGPDATDDDIRSILAMGTWAVVGATPDPAKPSHTVPRFLQGRGKRIVPVTPAHAEILGERCWPDLTSVPGPVDVVELFRRSSKVGPHVDEAIAVGARAVWMQLDVVDRAAARRARRAGLLVVMDRCPKIEWGRLGPPAPDRSTAR